MNSGSHCGKNPDASKELGDKAASAGTLRGLDWLNFFLAGVQTGVGPFLAIYLAGYRWNEESVGLALTVGGISGILMQTPAGALVDRLRSKRLPSASFLSSCRRLAIDNFWRQPEGAQTP
jgi:MFS family permease